MNILDLYKKYNIMPNLQEHQLRVAAVAKMICDNFEEKVNCTDVVVAMLLHDMGNIIKFNLKKFPQFCEPEGLEYWRSVQDDFKDRYGSDEHQAHLKIAHEIGVSDRIVALMDAVDFGRASENRDCQNWETKICAYADTRVGPFGVLSQKERLDEGRERYEIDPDEERWDLITSAYNIERQIFAHCTIQPEDITDESINHIQEELENYEVSTRS